MSASCSCRSNTASDGPQTVFVYGTLKRGGSNQHWLAQADYLGPAETCAAYALYLGDDPWPYLVADEPCYPVSGELYRVSPAQLAALDDLEECPHLYTRQRIDVRGADGAVQAAWTYFAVNAPGQRLAAGVWPAV